MTIWQAVAIFVATPIVLGLFGMFMSYRERRKKPKQTCWCYCPNCKVDLVSNPGVTYTDEDVVTYTCTCGKVSRWLFDAPCPLYLPDRQPAPAE